MRGALTISWTFPYVSELLALGGGGGPPIAIAGYYIRGAYDFKARKGHWSGPGIGGEAK